jgi:hypothetical protein
VAEESESSGIEPPADATSTETLDNAIHKSGAPRSLHHDKIDSASQSADASHVSQIIVVDKDIIYQSTVATEMPETQQDNAKSSTSFTAKKRTMSILPRHRTTFGQNNADIELAGISHASHPSTSLHVEESAVAPHERDYYENSWYISLAVFNYCQTLLVSSGVLTGAPSTNSNYSNFAGLFGSDKNFAFMLLNLLNWLTVYAPLSSVIMTLPYIIPLKIRARLRGWHILRRWHRSLRRIERLLIFCVAGFCSIDTLIGFPVPLPLDNVSIVGRFLPLLILSLLIAVYLPWYWVILRKSKREAAA